MNGFQLKIINKAKVRDGRLTEFEKEFVTDLGFKHVGYVLSKKQNHVLNTISEKIYR